MYGIRWSDTTGPRVIAPDPVLATLFRLTIEKQARIDALTEANEALLAGLRLKDAEIEALRAEKSSLRKSLLRWLGSLER